MVHVKPISVWAHSLGCPKNRVDTERLLGSLGFSVRLVAHPGRARLIFINTCAFIEPAARESIAAIIEAVEKVDTLKKKPLLAVAGCLPGRYGIIELKREFPQVDVWLAPENQAQWPQILTSHLRGELSGKPGRILSTGPAYAWLKIAEGCNHRCAFCVIPKIRGAAVSENMETLIAEAQKIVEAGMKEIDIVAQDVLAWGRDLPGAPLLTDLLASLATLPGLAWLRLFYLYPAAITPIFLETMAKIGRPLLPYLDIPFQHASPEVLTKMGRPFKVDPAETVRLVRSILPDAALRATLIVGYPGETESQFQELCEFVQDTRFHNLGVFVFHAEEGTQASRLPNQIPREVAEKRREIIMTMQAAISRDILAQYVGQRMEVLIDEFADDEWPGLRKGRVWFQAPEVDGRTYISGSGADPGVMIDAEIVDSQVYDLSALI